MDLCLSSSVSGKSLHVAAWDVTTGVIHRVYSSECGSTENLSNEGAYLCILGHDHILCSVPSLPLVHVWNSYKEQPQLKMACPGVVLAITCSPDNVHCAAAIGDKIHIWEVCSGHLLAVASLHYQPVRVLQFTDDSVHLVSGGEDCRVVVWRVARVLSDAFDTSGRQLPHTTHTPTSLTGDTSLTRHVWSHHSQAVTSLHCGRGGLDCRVVTASLDQTAKLYELSSGSLLCSILFDYGLTSVTMDPSEHFLFVGGYNGQISQINLFINLYSKNQSLGTMDEDSSYQTQFIGHSKAVTGLTVSTLSGHLVSCSHEDSVRVWDIPSRQTIRQVKMKGPVSSLAKPGLEFMLTKPPERGVSWLVPTPLNVLSFKKQLYHKRTDSQNTLFPRTRRRIDPLCDLDSLKELQFGCSLPPVLKHSTESLGDHKVRQELSEVKEVNKKLYKFMMEQLFEPSTKTTTER